MMHPHDDRPHLLSLRAAGKPAGLHAVIREIVADAAEERRLRGLPAVRVEVDVAAGHAAAIDAASLRAGLLPLVRAAFQSAALGAEARRLCEVVITSVDTGSALEIEVADSSPGSAADPTAATVAAIATAGALAERCGGGIGVAACPEGGLAVTLRIPHRKAHGLAA